MAEGLPPGQIEAHRNRLLRRADWRFLLPDPEPGLTVSFARGRLHAAVCAVSGEVVRPGGASVGSCDLAVVSNPDASTLRQALALVKPDGALYGEWTDLRVVSPGTLRRFLATAGATPSHIYWPWPWPGVYAPKFWMPVASQGARRYLTGPAAPARAPILRAGGRLLEAALAGAQALRVFYPLCAVARPLLPGGRETTDRAGGLPIPLHVLDALRTVASEHDVELGSDAAWLLLTTGPRSVSKVVGLLLDRGSPRLAVKLARTPDAEPGLRREAEALRMLAERVPEAASSAPAVLSYGGASGYTVVVETALAGRPAWRAIDARTRRPLALRVTRWLCELVDGGQQPVKVWWERLVESVLQRFAQQFGPVSDPALIVATRARLIELPALPRAFEHRDLGPWNILLDESGGGVLVLDWESAEPDGLPGMDLFYFLAHLGAVGRPTVRARHLERAHAEEESLERECLDLYAVRTGIAPESLQPLKLLSWMLHSASDHRHLSADFGKAPPAEALRRSRFYRLWLNEAARASAVGYAS